MGYSIAEAADPVSLQDKYESARCARAKKCGFLRNPPELLGDVIPAIEARRGVRCGGVSGAAHADHPENWNVCKSEVQPLYLFISDGVGGI